MASYSGKLVAMNALLRKQPDRVSVHEAIDRVRMLGYLYPAERDALLAFTVQVFKQSVRVEGGQADLKQVLHERQATGAIGGKKIAWIHNGAKERQMPVGMAVPDGWQLGRLPANTEGLKQGTAAAAEVNRGSTHDGYSWYNDGSQNVQVKDGQTPPHGYVLGRFIEPERKALLINNLRAKD